MKYLQNSENYNKLPEENEKTFKPQLHTLGEKHL